MYSKLLNNPPSSPSSSSQTQACAACKYQRRRCKSDCIFAPYFPADRFQAFQNALRHFGVGNILKIIRNLNPQKRDEAMRSIIFESNARAMDPVGGCHRIVLDLQRQIERVSMELELVLQQKQQCIDLYSNCDYNRLVEVAKGEGDADALQYCSSSKTSEIKDELNPIEHVEEPDHKEIVFNFHPRKF